MRRFCQIVFVSIMSACLISSCASMSTTAKSTAIGGGGGAAVGAGVGALFNGGDGAAVGAGVGAVAGAIGGYFIGKHMEKQRAELEKIEAAKIETVIDANNYESLKVTFSEKILFATGKSDLSQSSINALTSFAQSLNNNPDTNIEIQGHTDNTGSRSINEKLSVQRAESVASFLKGKGVAGKRLNTVGLAYDVPVADNSTAAGRAENRRVEIYITANEKMIQEAKQSAQ